MMKKASKSLVVAWLSVFLASCSEEPSEKDISNALDQVLRTEKDQLTGLTMGLIGGPWQRGAIGGDSIKSNARQRRLAHRHAIVHCGGNILPHPLWRQQ